MKHRITLLALVAGSLVIALAAPACSSPQTPSPTAPPKAAAEAPKAAPTTSQAPAAIQTPAAAPAKTPSVLVIAGEGSPPTFDPLAANDSRVDLPSLTLYSALVQVKGDTLEIEPDLAESYQASSDGKSFTFKLRKGAKFHDGTEVTAADVKYTVDRMMALKTGYAGVLAAIGGAEVQDDHTVVIKTKDPFPALPRALVRLYVLNSKLLKAQEKDGDWGKQWLATNDAGSGPYKLVSFQPEQQWTAERFADYHKGWSGSHVDRVIYRVIKEESTRRLALEKGDVDAAWVGSADAWESLKKAQGVQVDSFSTLNQMYFAFNHKKKYTADARIRHAISLVYDYKGHVEKARNGHADVAQGPLPKAIPFHDGSIAPSEMNVQKAKQLMAEAGYPNGGFELSVAYQGTSPEETAAVQILQSGASQLGITIKPVAMEWPAKVGAFSKEETSLDMATQWIYPGYADPDVYFYRMLHSSQAGGGGVNFAWHSDPKIDELLVSARSEMDQNKRGQMYKEIQQYWMKEMPYMNVTVMHALTASRDYVKGFKWSPAHTQAPFVYNMSVEGKPAR